MTTRYCGQLKIDMDCEGLFEGRLKFVGTIITPEGDRWYFDVLVKPGIPEQRAFDMAAAGGVHYGSMYGPGYDPDEDEGTIPNWAPAPSIARNINDSVAVADQGYCIRREIDGPTTYIG